MGNMNKLVFREEGGKAYIEFCSDDARVQYAFNDEDEVFDTLSVMAKCVAADMEANGIEYTSDYQIACEGSFDTMMQKFSEPQLRAIMKVLYERDLPSDLDVLALEIQMRMR